MTKYDQQDHLEVLTELTVLYKLQNETQSKINIANERPRPKHTRVSYSS